MWFILFFALAHACCSLATHRIVTPWDTWTIPDPATTMSPEYRMKFLYGYGPATCYIKPHVYGMRTVTCIFKVDLKRLQARIGGMFDEWRFLVTPNGNRYDVHGAVVRDGDALEAAHLALEFMEKKKTTWSQADGDFYKDL